MIRPFAMLCRFLNKKISDEELLSLELENIKLKDVQCPYCKRSGTMINYHHGYTRYMVSPASEPAGKTAKIIYIARAKCADCGHTHELLPGIMMAFSSYSVSFVLYILFLYYVRQNTVEEICENHCISHSQLYRWLQRFREHLQKLQEIINSLEADPQNFILSLDEASAHRFLQTTGISFLHRYNTNIWIETTDLR